MKPRSVRWTNAVGHTGETRNSYRVFFGKAEIKRHGHTYMEHCCVIYLKESEFGGVCSTHLPSEKTLLNRAINK
jgi:hypothetical protein